MRIRKIKRDRTPKQDTLTGPDVDKIFSLLSMRIDHLLKEVGTVEGDAEAVELSQIRRRLLNTTFN